MRGSRKLGIALVLTVVASATIGGSIASSAAAPRGHRSSGHVIFKGTSAPLRQLARPDRAVAPAARPSRSAGSLNGRVQANLAHIDQVNALEQESGSSAEGLPAPKVKPLPQDLSGAAVIASWE